MTFQGPFQPNYSVILWSSPQESQGKRTAKRFPKVTSLPVYHSSTSAIQVYHERRIELSKKAKLWSGMDLTLPCAPQACSGFQLSTFSMTINISATCPKLSQDDTGQSVGILPHGHRTHRKLARNCQQHSQSWQRPLKVKHFLLLHCQNRTLQRCRIIRLAL